MYVSIWAGGAGACCDLRFPTFVDLCGFRCCACCTACVVTGCCAVEVASRASGRGRCPACGLAPLQATCSRIVAASCLPKSFHSGSCSALLDLGIRWLHSWCFASVVRVVCTHFRHVERVRRSCRCPSPLGMCGIRCAFGCACVRVFRTLCRRAKVTCAPIACRILRAKQCICSGAFQYVRELHISTAAA